MSGPVPMSGVLQVAVSSRGIASLVLNRPDRANALDQVTLDALAQQIAERGADAATRVVVLRGNGKNFCGGADLAARRDDGEAPKVSLVDVLAALDRCPKPVAAVVQGAAVGGGAALAACCDVVIAAEGAFFSIPEVRVGMAGLGVAPFLIRAMGHRSFRRYGLTGERIPATEALRLGLAHEVVRADEIEQKLDAVVDALLHGAPGAQQELKGGMEHWITPSVAAILKGQTPHTRTAETIEGVASFKEKRKPNWYPQ
jgi:methylglutaconyl-CoA hydratase